MGKRIERRSAIVGRLCPVHSLKLGGSTAQTCAALVGLAATAATADVMVTSLWLGPIYLLVICAAAWALGTWPAIGLGIVSLGFSYYANGYRFHWLGTESQPSDLLLRWLSVLLAILLVAAARRLYLREWHLARTDLLTGAMNRQAFFEIVSRAPPAPTWTVIAYADLDGLKQINDVCGHEEGDEALRGFSAAVRRSIRKTDLFARLGGDEFVVCMEVRDEAAAKLTAARLHRAMNGSVGRRIVSARCSLGVVILPPGFSRGADRLRVADRLMYEAKQQGAALVSATMTDPHNCAALVRHDEPSAAGGASAVAAIPQGVTAAA